MLFALTNLGNLLHASFNSFAYCPAMVTVGLDRRIEGEGEGEGEGGDREGSARGSGMHKL